jgi:N-acyl-phosphatidylethanolamine-hydrolysing phospholipase D
MSTLIPTQTPTWGTSPEHASKIKATWLGHAAFLVELPTPHGAARGPRILFDPALSPRCSAVQWAGPSRYTGVPCNVEDVPAVDAVVISHNHYDHMDEETLKILEARYKPHVFAPLGNADVLRSFGYPADRVHCLDWWDGRALQLALPPATAASDSDSGSNSGSSAEGKDIKAVETKVEITCTPAQHTANRSVHDRWRSLWASWAVTAQTGEKVYFGGDTAYRTVRDGEDEEMVPTCPAFREIGEKFGGFDLALLPIGWVYTLEMGRERLEG